MIVELNNISYSYDQAEDNVIKDLNFSLAPGERAALVGANGSGKTTLFKIIMGLLEPKQGEIIVFNQRRTSEADFEEVRERIGFLFQEPTDQLFCPTVEEELEFGPLNLDLSKQEVDKRVNRVLAELGIENLRHQVPWQLSGGEKKLVALGAVLTMEPEVLLLDEPFLGIDKEHQQQLVTLLKNLEQTYVIISHHDNLLAAITDQKYSMEGLQ